MRRSPCWHGAGVQSRANALLEAFGSVSSVGDAPVQKVEDCQSRGECLSIGGSHRVFRQGADGEGVRARVFACVDWPAVARDGPEEAAVLGVPHAFQEEVHASAGQLEISAAGQAMCVRSGQRPDRARLRHQAATIVPGLAGPERQQAVGETRLGARQDAAKRRGVRR